MSLDADLVAVLQRENDELRDRVVQLEEMLGLRLVAPIELALTGSEAKLFGMLATREMATKPAIMTLLYSARPDTRSRRSRSSTCLSASCAISSSRSA